jgi:hypothetical protein
MAMLPRENVPTEIAPIANKRASEKQPILITPKLNNPTDRSPLASSPMERKPVAMLPMARTPFAFRSPNPMFT